MSSMGKSQIAVMVTKAVVKYQRQPPISIRLTGGALLRAGPAVRGNPRARMKPNANAERDKRRRTICALVPVVWYH